MNPEHASYINMVLLIVLAGLACLLITMILWLICLARELRSEIRAQVTESMRLATAKGCAEIRALRAKASDGSLTHTDDLGP